MAYSPLLASHTNIIPLAGHVVYSPQPQRGVGWARKDMLLLKTPENETLNFIKRRSLKRIQFIVLNQ